MLDFDLAELYQVETKRLKEAVRRNIERFEGDDFMFVLSEKEYEILRTQIATSSLTSQNASSNWGGRRGASILNIRRLPLRKWVSQCFRVFYAAKRQYG